MQKIIGRPYGAQNLSEPHPGLKPRLNVQSSLSGLGIWNWEFGIWNLEFKYWNFQFATSLINLILYNLSSSSS